MGQHRGGCQKGNSTRLHQLSNILLMRHPVHRSCLQQGGKKASHCHYCSSLIVTCPALGLYILRTCCLGDPSFRAARTPDIYPWPHLMLVEETECRWFQGAQPLWGDTVPGCGCMVRNFRYPQTKEQGAQRRIVEWIELERCSASEAHLPPGRWGKRLREGRDSAKEPQRVTRQSCA